MLTQSEELELIRLLDDEETWQSTKGRLFELYPETGPYRRGLYPKHMAFFAAGATHSRRAFMAANRIGKTWGVNAYEATLHLTGMYDEVAPWWQGRVWDRPINCLMGGDTSATTRDILVTKLLGPEGARGTGLIPKARILDIAPAPGVRGHVDYARIAHTSGSASTLQFRSYDQGREAWQGTERDLIGLDEEPPMDIYTEATTRTLTTLGSVILTFTPLNGMTDVALKFAPEFGVTA